MDFATFKKSLPRKPIVEVDNLPWPKIASGKVREIFDLGENLLIIATDRLSAFDVVLPEGIPAKGIILTQLSLYWFEESQQIIENHLVENHKESLKDLLADYPHLIARSMLVKKLDPLPVEAVVRGYLSGSGWKSYHCSLLTVWGPIVMLPNTGPIDSGVGSWGAATGGSKLPTIGSAKASPNWANRSLPKGAGEKG